MASWSTRKGTPIPGVHLVVVEGDRRGTAATTPEGTFFDREGPGEFRITAELEGYETQEVTVIVAPNEIREVEIVLEATGD